jgi:hypothetical protein
MMTSQSIAMLAGHRSAKDGIVPSASSVGTARLGRARPARPIGATNRLGLGDEIRPIPRHCDPIPNLYA